MERERERECAYRPGIDPPFPPLRSRDMLMRSLREWLDRSGHGLIPQMDDDFVDLMSFAVSEPDESRKFLDLVQRLYSDASRLGSRRLTLQGAAASFDPLGMDGFLSADGDAVARTAAGLGGGNGPEARLHPLHPEVQAFRADAATVNRELAVTKARLSSTESRMQLLQQMLAKKNEELSRRRRDFKRQLLETTEQLFMVEQALMRGDKSKAAYLEFRRKQLERLRNAADDSDDEMDDVLGTGAGTDGAVSTGDRAGTGGRPMSSGQGGYGLSGSLLGNGAGRSRAGSSSTSHHSLELASLNEEQLRSKIQDMTKHHREEMLAIMEQFGPPELREQIAAARKRAAARGGTVDPAALLDDAGIEEAVEEIRRAVQSGSEEDRKAAVQKLSRAVKGATFPPIAVSGEPDEMFGSQGARRTKKNAAAPGTLADAELDGTGKVPSGKKSSKGGDRKSALGDADDDNSGDAPSVRVDI
jgi:hypothetical protein